MQLCYRILSLLMLVCLNNSALAVGTVGSGERLRVLQKIQGSWQTRCERQGKGDHAPFEESKLTVTYTDLHVERRIYRDHRCVNAAKVIREQYRYVLTEPVKSAQGKSVYAINLQSNSPGGKAGTWAALNIVSFEDGKLFFGLKTSGQENQRLTELDRNRPFYR